MALKFDAVISRLAEVEGDEQAVTSRHTLTNMIESANDNVVVCFNDVLQSIGKQVRNHIHIHLLTACMCVYLHMCATVCH